MKQRSSAASRTWSVRKRNSAAPSPRTKSPISRILAWPTCRKSRPELVAQEEVDVAQGKDSEASAGVSAAKDALAAAEQGVARVQGVT